MTDEPPRYGRPPCLFPYDGVNADQRGAFLLKASPFFFRDPETKLSSLDGWKETETLNDTTSNTRTEVNRRLPLLRPRFFDEIDRALRPNVDSRKGFSEGCYELKGYNSDDSRFLSHPSPLSARRSEQFIIIVHELERSLCVENVHRSACVRGRYVLLTSSPPPTLPSCGRVPLFFCRPPDLAARATVYFRGNLQ